MNLFGILYKYYDDLSGCWMLIDQQIRFRTGRIVRQIEFAGVVNIFNRLATFRIVNNIKIVLKTVPKGEI